jgi:hypothetical protein
MKHEVRGMLAQGSDSVINVYMLSEHRPDAMPLTYPDAGHGSLFQVHESVAKQASRFLDFAKVMARMNQERERGSQFRCMRVSSLKSQLTRCRFLPICAIQKEVLCPRHAVGLR